MTMKLELERLEPVVERTLFGRLYHPDPKDQNFPLRASRLAAAIVSEKMWKTGATLDQGNFPHCVGYMCRHNLNASPVMERIGRALPDPVHVYTEAQKVDEWPGENYEGTSVRAGMKVLQALGLLTEYHWAFDPLTMKNYVLTRGPLALGTDWFTGMSTPVFRDNPKVSGQFNDAYITPAGAYQGGHAWLVIGYSRKRDAYRMQNSWGASWGEKGRAWIERAHLEYLVFGLNGEACSVLEAG